MRVKRPGAYESGAAEKGIAMTLDCNHRYCSIDPKQGAALSVAEAVRNITAVGAEPIGISDNLNFGAPHKPTGMWQIAEGIRGLGEAARAFNVPIISGNVSLNNETNGKAISPTPLVAMVGLMKDSSHAATVYFKKEGDLVFCIGETSDEDLGGSEYLATIHGVEKGILPKLNYEKEKKTSALIVELINQGLIASCHDVGTGGLAVAFAESCMSMYGKVGASIVPVGYNGRKDGLLFAETGARYLVSCKSGNEKKFRAECEKHGVVISAEGKVGGSRIEVVGYASLDLDAAYAAWHGGLDELFA